MASETTTAKTFDQSLDEVARLVKHYQTNRASFHAPGYQEAHAWHNLSDPLFIALDWDGHNAPLLHPSPPGVTFASCRARPGFAIIRIPRIRPRAGTRQNARSTWSRRNGAD